MEPRTVFLSLTRRRKNFGKRAIGSARGAMPWSQRRKGATTCAVGVARIFATVVGPDTLAYAGVRVVSGS